MIRKLVGLLVVTILLTVPTTGSAYRKQTQYSTTNPVRLALKIGEKYWGNTPCHGAITVTASEPVTPDASMWTYIVATPAEEVDLASCSIYISKQSWPNWYVDDLNFEDFCKYTLHEIGHLEGYSDESAVIDTIQYEEPQLARVPLCEHYQLYYGHHMFTPPVEESWEQVASQ